MLPYLRSCAAPMQVTSMERPTLGLAMQDVRMFQLHGKRMGLSTGLVFLDIASAFYQVLRQHALGMSFADEDVMSLLRSLGVTDLYLDDVARLLSGDAPLELLDVPSHLAAMVREFHHQTWFVLQNDAKVVAAGARRWLCRPDMGSGPGSQLVPLALSCWADDVCIKLHASCGDRLVPMVQRTAEVVVEQLGYMGMKPNFSPGKTEAILDFRGRGCRQLRRFVFEESKGDIHLRVPGEETCKLRAVARYKHLGGIIVHGGRRPQGPAALHGVGAWPALNGAESRAWHSDIMRLFRQVLRAVLPLDVRTHLRDEEAAWLDCLKGDMVWLYSNIQGFTGHPPPDDFDYWNSFIARQPGRWKKLLRRVQAHDAGQLRLWADVHSFRRQLLSHFTDYGLQIPRHLQLVGPQEVQEVLHTCFICDRSWPSFRAWAVHAYKKHGRLSQWRHLQGGDTCIACGHAFPSHARLIRHLRVSKTCGSMVASANLWVDAEPSFGSVAVRQEENDLRLSTWRPTTPRRRALPEGWLTTYEVRQLYLKWITFDVDDADHTTDRCLTDLRELPVHWNEFLDLLCHVRSFYNDE
eukprot:s119_g82.t1